MDKAYEIQQKIKGYSKEQNKETLKVALRKLYVEYDNETTPTERQRLKKQITAIEERIVELNKRAMFLI